MKTLINFFIIGIGVSCIGYYTFMNINNILDKDGEFIDNLGQIIITLLVDVLVFIAFRSIYSDFNKHGG